MVRVDLRTVTLTIPPQEVITRDNVPGAGGGGLLLPRRRPGGRGDARSRRSRRRRRRSRRRRCARCWAGPSSTSCWPSASGSTSDLQQIIDEQTEPWGIKVTTVEIKDVEIPEAMQRAMARQAEAERERRAKVIDAEGEFQAAEKLAGAAAIIGREPAALQLRYLQTLLEIGADQSSTIVFPLPLDLIKPFLDRRRPPGPRRGVRERLSVDGRLDARPVPAPRRAGVLRRRPAHAGGRGRPGLARRTATRWHARGRAPLRHRQPRRARRAPRDRRGDGHRYDLWDDSVLQVKLMVFVLIGVLIAFHLVSPESRAVAIAVFCASLVAVWLGVALARCAAG